MLIKLLILLVIPTFIFAADPPLTLYDEGTKQGVIFEVNCTGAGVSCTKSGIRGTLDITGGGGGVGVGTVNPGIAGRFTYYPSTGTTVDDQTVLTLSGSNIGIGTDGANSKLVVNGGAQVGNGYITVVAPSNGMIVEGNVGIGSWQPTAKLDIIGGIKATSDITISGVSVCQEDGTNCPAGGSSQWLTTSGVGIGTYDNVGIGTAKPDKELHIKRAATAVIGVDVTGTSSAATFYPQNTTDSSYAQLSVQGSAIAGTTLGEDSAGQAYLALRPATGALATIGTVNNTALVMGTNSAEQLRFFAGGDLALNRLSNNVGIGTSVPGTKLYVAGNTTMQGFTLPGNGVATGRVLQTNSVGVGTWVNANTLPTSITLTTTGTSGASTLTGNVLNIPQYTGGAGSSQWITTASVGIGTYDNVSVGTISSGSKVTVLGNIGIGTVIGDAYLTTVAPVGGMIVQGNVGIGTFSPFGKFIVSGGNVGIGSLAPGQALDVNGSIRLSNAGDSYFQGNVGVGTTIPMNTMAIQGSLAVGSVTFTGTANNTNDSTFSGNIGIGTTRTTTAALTVMNGNVGIGTWVPSTAFSVKGGALTALQSGANTACTTTCGAFGCYAAFDTSSGWVGVDCTDASADKCFCSK